MEFHSWQTMFDEFRMTHKGKKTPDQIFEIELENILSTDFKNPQNRWKRLVRLVTERAWISAGKPYYNIHPKLVESLCKINLEKIPSEYIEMPANLEVVCFRFADDVPIKYADNSGAVFISEKITKDSPVYCRSVLFSKISVDANNKYAKLMPEMKDTNQFVLILDEGFRVKTEKIDRTLCNLVTFGAKKNQNIPESIKETIANLGSTNLDKIMYLTMGERLSNLLKVVISSGFMANTPDEGLVVPDILSKDRIAYSEAIKKNNIERAKQIVERAHRRGKIGYNIGTNEMFVGEVSAKSKNVSESTGRELEYSHLRGGHPHAVRYGEGRKKVKIKWFRPTRIRPDLPFKG